MADVVYAGSTSNFVPYYVCRILVGAEGEGEGDVYPGAMSFTNGVPTCTALGPSGIIQSSDFEVLLYGRNANILKWKHKGDEVHTESKI